jgi:hypothetical protein
LGRLHHLHGLATFVSVFTLGLQSLNVNQGHYLAAAVTSFFIGSGHIFLYRYMPAAGVHEFIAYYLGGITGITFSIWFHKRAKAWLAFQRARWRRRAIDRGVRRALRRRRRPMAHGRRRSAPQPRHPLNQRGEQQCKTRSLPH